MKPILILSIVLALTGCNQPCDDALQSKLEKLSASQEELRKQVSAFEQALAKSPPRLRYATAKKHEISVAISKRTGEFIKQARKARNLTPEQETSVAEYEKAKNELFHIQYGNPSIPRTVPSRTLRVPPGSPVYNPEEVSPELVAARQKVAAAKEPVAEIIDWLDRLNARYRETYSEENVLAAYVKGQFDLVLDATFSSHNIIYEAPGDVPDITKGAIAFANEFVKPLEAP